MEWCLFDSKTDFKVQLYNVIKIYCYINILFLCYLEASRGAGAQSVTVQPTGLWVRSPLDSRIWNIYLHLYFHFFALVSGQSAVLSSATQHAMPPGFGKKCGTEWLNIMFLLSTLLCAKLKKTNRSKLAGHLSTYQHFVLIKVPIWYYNLNT